MVRVPRKLLGPLKVLAVALCCYHAASVALAGLVPRKSAVARAFMPYFRDYLLATGNSNTWAMFIDRPAYRRFHVSIVAETPTGEKREFGPMLPGLEPYDDGLRSFKVFHSFNRGKFRRFRTPYLDQARREIASLYGFEPKKVKLRYDVEKLNLLAEIRKTGVLSHEKGWKRGR